MSLRGRLVRLEAGGAAAVARCGACGGLHQAALGSLELTLAHGGAVCHSLSCSACRACGSYVDHLLDVLHAAERDGTAVATLARHGYDPETLLREVG